MPVTPTYPGVYIEEIPSGVRTITGVATSIAAFIDYFIKGPVNKAVQILNMGDFNREFGGLDTNSEASYGIQQFFYNGGTGAWVVRVVSGSVAAAKVEISNTIPAAGVPITVTSISEGEWGNNLRIEIDPTAPAADEFNLMVTELEIEGQKSSVVRQEIFRNLSMDDSRPNHVVKVINDANMGSKLIQVTANGTEPPVANGTLSGGHTSKPEIPESPSVTVTIGTGGDDDVSATASLIFTDELPRQQPYTRIASALQSAIRRAVPNNPTFAGATVEAFTTEESGTTKHCFRVLTGPGNPLNRVRFTNFNGNETASNLLLTTGVTKRTATISGVHTENPDFLDENPKINAEINGISQEVTIEGLPAGAGTSLKDIAQKLQTAISGVDATEFNDVIVVADGDKRLVVLAGDSASEFGFENAPSDTTADILKLTGDAVINRKSTLSDNHSGPINLPTPRELEVMVDGTTKTATLEFPSDLDSFSLELIAPVLQTAIRAADPSNSLFNDALVVATGDQLIVLPGGDDPSAVISFANTGASTAADILLLTPGRVSTVNLQEYTLGGGAVSDTAQKSGARGENGDPPDEAAIIGDSDSKEGIYALKEVDIFNLLCIPRTAISQLNGGLSNPKAVIDVAQTFCEERRAFLLIDTPQGVDEVDEIKNIMANTTRHRNAAIYYPRVKIPDPLDNYHLRSVGASGTIAGLFARTDATRGAWKAPAGTEAVLRNVAELDDVLTDAENGKLNERAINCLRRFPNYGLVCWGSRTLEGSDQTPSEWKYVPVRRVALYIEESLYRGTQWVVHEPNDEPLWGQIRLNIGAFMHTLFRQGAFQGRTRREAYLVKCDRETTTQDDINRGVVNIVVGFAPLKPVEFVIIKIQQLAGQIQI